MKNKFLGEKIKSLRLRKKLSLRGLAIKCPNLTYTTISRIENGDINTSINNVQEIATALNVSVDYLLGKETNIEKVSFTRNVNRVAVYGSIPAGIPIEMIDESYIEEYEDIDNELAQSGKFFGLKVKGNSMYPEFRDGDIIIFKKQESCENGSYCAVSINHTECTFKKVLLKESGITLMPINPEYEPIFFTNNEIEQLPITILGIVKEVRRTY